jgi:ribonuclease T1
VTTGRRGVRIDGPAAARIAFVHRAAVVGLVVVLGIAGCAAGVTAPPAAPPASPPASTHAVDPASGLVVIEVVDLPQEARTAILRIRAGGPFPYSQDGAVFQNREGLLPAHPAGWYHEYTVETPGSGDRGARRIVAGDDGTFYWTDDHYASFRAIRR